MLSRETKMRREYIEKRKRESLTHNESIKKEMLRKALENDKSVPKSIRGEAKQLLSSLKAEDAETKNIKDMDEYEDIGLITPDILMTTSRDPSQRLSSFLKEMKLIIPNSTRVNRGNVSLNDIFKIAKDKLQTDVIVVHESKGKPDGLLISHIPYGPTAQFTLDHVVLRHDLIQKPHNASMAFPHLIFHNFSQKVGLRVKTILQSIFPTAPQDSTKCIAFQNRSDKIHVRHYGNKKDGDSSKDVKLTEIGPRFDLMCFKITQGLPIDKACTDEFVFKPFINTAKNKKWI